MGNDFGEKHRGAPREALHLASRKDVEELLYMLSSSPGISAWQVEQATDSLTIPLGSVIGQEWVRTHGTLS